MHYLSKKGSALNLGGAKPTRNATKEFEKRGFIFFIH
jgi:hypothetical protein